MFRFTFNPFFFHLFSFVPLCLREKTVNPYALIDMKSFLCGISLLLTLAFPARAEEPVTPDTIKKLGGLALPYHGGGWEVEFHLRGRFITNDDSLKSLPALGEVRSLNLRDIRVTDAGMVHLKKLTQLRRLHLERTPVTDEGIAHLAGLVHLEYLNLYGTAVTDKALEHLTGMKKLEQLYLWQTDVTAEGVAKLEKALPKVRVLRGVDLEKLVVAKAPPPVMEEELKWMPGSNKPAKSTPGSNIIVTFQNKSKQKIKLFWVEYSGGLKLYGEIDPGAERKQNTYSGAYWVVTDLNDQQLGHFLTGQKYATAVIP